MCKEAEVAWGEGVFGESVEGEGSATDERVDGRGKEWLKIKWS